MSRQSKDCIWNVLSPDGRSALSVEHAILSVLMDIRDELQAIRADQIATSVVVRSRLNCTETLSLPHILRRIAANTHKPKRKRAKR